MTGGHKDEIPSEDASRPAEADRLALSEHALEWLRIDEEHAWAVVWGDGDATAEYERAATELGPSGIDGVYHHTNRD